MDLHLNTTSEEKQTIVGYGFAAPPISVPAISNTIACDRNIKNLIFWPKILYAKTIFLNPEIFISVGYNQGFNAGNFWVDVIIVDLKKYVFVPINVNKIYNYFELMENDAISKLKKGVKSKQKKTQIKRKVKKKGVKQLSDDDDDDETDENEVAEIQEGVLFTRKNCVFFSSNKKIVLNEETKNVLLNNRNLIEYEVNKREINKDEVRQFFNSYIRECGKNNCSVLERKEDFLALMFKSNSIDFYEIFCDFLNFRRKLENEIFFFNIIN